MIILGIIKELYVECCGNLKGDYKLGLDKGVGRVIERRVFVWSFKVRVRLLIEKKKNIEERR